LNLLIACHWHYHLQLLQLLDPCDIEPDLVWLPEAYSLWLDNHVVDLVFLRSIDVITVHPINSGCYGSCLPIAPPVDITWVRLDCRYTVLSAITRRQQTIYWPLEWLE
jgi:hypothetical protein